MGIARGEYVIINPNDKSWLLSPCKGCTVLLRGYRSSGRFAASG